jgi:cytochrome c oxidase assembly protein subunit 15
MSLQSRALDIGASHDRRATHTSGAIVAWLYICATMIFAMAVIGAITRLTESGLSITEWKPVTGALPPLNEAEWQDAFDKYKQIPEYLAIHGGMTLAEFKNIFWWEFIHRLLGRLIGVVYLVPFLWFVARGAIDRALGWRLAGIFALGGLQGALGWYMVASGLVDRVDVSPYRLTAHLGLAIVIYAATIWTAFGLTQPGRRASATANAALALAALVFVTILSGGFVAGNDAGMVYNTFPTMNGEWVPGSYFADSPAWVNLFENVAAVQFNHRVLAITTFCAALVFWAAARRRTQDDRARRAVDSVAAMALLQVGLGISTLLLVVPIPLAAAHQAGGILLLTAVLAAAHALRRDAAMP